MAYLIPLSEQEIAALIRAARPYQAVHLTLGGSLIADRAPWAIALVELWRGNAVTDGAGI